MKHEIGTKMYTEIEFLNQHNAEMKNLPANSYTFEKSTLDIKTVICQ